MRKIAVFTGTRAEYGLLFNLIKAIDADHSVCLQLIVSGIHLSPFHGETWQEILADGFPIADKIEIILATNSPVGIVKSMGLGLINYAESLSKLKPDILVLLGDRFETFAIAQSALILNIPIAHIHGGELTFGAYDDSLRHSITKMANLHFVANVIYKKRIIQMGENPALIHDVGALGVEQIIKTPKISKQKLAKILNLPLNAPYFLITYHPVTKVNESPSLTFAALLEALQEFKDYFFIFTYPNGDNGSCDIIKLCQEFCQSNNRARVIKSLDKNYISVLAQAKLILGNSSSGIIEAPSLNIPTVDIGIRQLGRMKAGSILTTDTSVSNIITTIKKALSKEFKDFCLTTKNPYGKDNTSALILTALKNYDLTNLKIFYDLEF